VRMWYGWMFGMHLLWWVFWLALVGILIALVVRQGSPPPPPGAAHPLELTPLQLLERRYANGEISTEEFEERKKHLAGNAR